MATTSKRRKTMERRAALSFSTDASSSLALVFKYLNAEVGSDFSKREGRQRGMDALAAFWKPYALRSKQVDSGEVRKAARNSVEAIARHLRGMCEEFDIPLPFEQQTPDWEALLQNLLTRTSGFPVGMPSPSVNVEPLPHHSDPAPDAEPEFGVIYADDADLLGDLA